MNRDAIKLSGDADTTATVCQKIGIPYIPLYTPIKRLPENVSSAKLSQSELLEFEMQFGQDYASSNCLVITSGCKNTTLSCHYFKKLQCHLVIN